MTAARGWWLDLEHLRLTVEPDGEHWEVFVYDRIARLVIYRAKRMTLHGAKIAAVEYALLHLGDPEHRQNPEEVAEALRWKAIGKAAVQ